VALAALKGDSDEAGHALNEQNSASRLCVSISVASMSNVADVVVDAFLAFSAGQNKNLLPAEGDPLMHSKECLSRRLRPALRPSDTRGASPFGPVGDNEISSSFLEMDGFRPKSGLRKTPSARRWRVTRRRPRGLPRCPRVVDPPLQASVSQ
jgi:hypothetical protein